MTPETAGIKHGLRDCGADARRAAFYNSDYGRGVMDADDPDYDY